MTIKIFSDRCNMTYKHFTSQPMSALELGINMVIAKTPQLIISFNRNKNHLLKKYSHTPYMTLWYLDFKKFY